ncbi:MAG: UDP-N-acetylmuramoyl-L-alanyl-D-glutamate--2,6-diaminopimelate ligase [Chitinophagaceae bacterium]|nr:UDP-N-acetylmuramoyl-L-alanyl-D-glutamate--2,6-diaminopimelate ligase [Chitinophagaceae bacterium]
MLLSEVLYKTPVRSVIGSTSCEVKGVTSDSRSVSSGFVFIAVKGIQSDGHHFIHDAVENGAAAVVCEKMPETIREGVVYVQVEDSARAAGIIAHNFYGKPSEKLILVGVTGTNGKTTIATLLYKLFSELGYTCGLISTVENKIAEQSLPSTHTTPDAISLNRLLHEMMRKGCSHVFMETSSHALHQQRVAGLQYTGAIFSNISHDHLDYHKTFDEYMRVKKSFFDGLEEKAFALSNADDKRGEYMLQNTKAKKYYYSLRKPADFKGKILDNTLDGLQMIIDDKEVHFRLFGEFNASNLMAVYGAARCLGEEKDKVLCKMSNLTGAEGRLDFIVSPEEKIMAIVDYAHTPDALHNVLSTISSLRKNQGKLITVVGCGGDRDKTKRPVMGKTACELSDVAIFTSDNPRSEAPEKIIQDMENGVTPALKKKLITISDRKEAIKTAVMLARPGDIILIAGKGHEKYQEVNGVKYPFDDKQVVSEMFGLLKK